MNVPKNIVLLTGLWAAAFLLSFLAPQLMEPTGDGFTRGLSRLGAFFLWQVSACVLAIFLFLIARAQLKSWNRKKWIFYLPLFIHLGTVVLVFGVILYAHFSAPPVSTNAPVTAPAPVVGASAAPAVVVADAEEPAGYEAPEPDPPVVETFMGIYRSGFEMSHFYTMNGQGPWWLEAEGTPWEKLQAHYVDGPGRAGGITVALTGAGYLEDAGGDLSAVGTIRQRFHLVSIESIRAITPEEFELIRETVTNAAGN